MYSVLYIDDEPGLLDLGKVFLEQTGDFSVTTSVSAQESLSRLTPDCYDVIISDYMMPEMDGITFLKEVRARDTTIPFILFTGRGREEVVIEAINNGADFYLQKGGDTGALFAELVHKIRLVVAKRRAEAALAESEEKYRLVVEHCFDVIFIFSQNRLQFANTNMSEVTGYSQNELMTMNPWDLIHPEDRSRLIESARQRISGEKPQSSGISACFLTKSGEIRNGTAFIARIMYKGKPAVLGIVRDITHTPQPEFRKII